MIYVLNCASCKKSLGCNVDGFDGKTLFISLDIQRFHSMCKECKHMKDLKCQLHFCSVKCLKDYVMDPECLDEYIRDEVFWGKFYEKNPQLKDGPVAVDGVV